MTVNRRQFVILGAGLLAGCAMGGAGAGNRQSSSAAGERTVDAGPADAFREEGVYDGFRASGIFPDPPGRPADRPRQHLHTPQLHPERRLGSFFHLPLPRFDLRSRRRRDQGAGAAQPAAAADPDR